MTEKKLSSREKIIRSALSLFADQGITATTTKQIAEQAGVNEVTLFRQFGSKQGLLLAVLKEASILEKMQAALTDIVGSNAPLMAYSESGLALLAKVPELVRSLIGEAGQSPLANQQALGQALRQANQQTIGYLSRAPQHPLSRLPIEDAASLLNTLLLGYAVMDFSSDDHGLWQSQANFLTAVERLLLGAERSPVDVASAVSLEDGGETVWVADLPAETVRSLFQTAKKLSAQAYALVYVLFGSGLRIEEAAALARSHSLSSKTQHLLTVAGPTARQVPLNRWIMGNRYGSYLKNPLTQWFKGRSDEQPAVFISEAGEPLGIEGIKALWAAIAQDSAITTGAPPTPFQARQTWCIELLMKGMSLENLSILSGLSIDELSAYARRAKEKAALEEAIAIDQKNP
ncbi:MAG: TetR family transcriptional regulator [Phormidesmis sp.]